MTAQNPAGWLANAGATHTARQMRMYFGSMFNGFSGTTPYGGIHPRVGGSFSVTQNGTPNMSVNVAAGIAYIPGTESPAQGVYFVWNDATVNLAIATAPGTGTSRIDLVVAMVQDQEYSGSTNAWSLAVVTGTASASPVAPAAPNNSLVLASIAVGANVTSIVTGNITDKRYFASALGAPMFAPSTAMPNTSTIPTGHLVYQTDTNVYKINAPAGTYNNLVEGQILGGVIVNSGVLQTIGATETLITNSTTPSIVLPPNRYIRLEAWLPGTIMSSSTGTALWHIRETNTTGTMLEERLMDGIGSTWGSTKFRLQYDFSSGAGATKTYCLCCSRLAGAGTVNTNGGFSLMVYDMGPISRVTVI